MIGRRVAGELRELVISFGKTGYVALYRFLPAPEQVRILAIRHQRELDISCDIPFRERGCGFGGLSRLSSGTEHAHAQFPHPGEMLKKLKCVAENWPNERSLIPNFKLTNGEY